MVGLRCLGGMRRDQVLTPPTPSHSTSSSSSSPSFTDPLSGSTFVSYWLSRF